MTRSHLWESGNSDLSSLARERLPTKRERKRKVGMLCEVPTGTCLILHTPHQQSEGMERSTIFLQTSPLVLTYVLGLLFLFPPRLLSLDFVCMYVCVCIDMCVYMYKYEYDI